jgi:hypothetical protein
MTPPQYRTEIAPWYTAKFWGAVGSFILLVALSFSPAVPFSASSSGLLQLPFTTPLTQHLGDISYSLYMMHGPMLYSTGHYIRKHADSQSPEMFWWEFMNCVVVWGGATIWRRTCSRGLLIVRVWGLGSGALGGVALRRSSVKGTEMGDTENCMDIS